MIVGCDPGATGALVLLDEHGDLADYLLMPTRQDGTKRAVDGAAIMHWLRDRTVDQAVIEKVSARPGQGVVSMFNFGRSYGIAETALRCSMLPVEHVTPQKWKAFFGFTGREKDATRLAAQERFGDEIFNLKAKGQAVADAAYIALWRYYNEAEH